MAAMQEDVAQNSSKPFTGLSAEEEAKIAFREQLDSDGFPTGEKSEESHTRWPPGLSAEQKSEFGFFDSVLQNKDAMKGDRKESLDRLNDIEEITHMRAT